MDFDQTLAGAKTCPNCGTLESAPGFCVECGQDNRRNRLKLDDLAHDALATMTDLDGRWFVTLRALFPHCGELATDYVAGRRARYASPTRLFLVLLIALFVGQELSSDSAVNSSTARWMPIALLLYVLPVALVLRVAFYRTRRTVAEISVLVLYAMSAVILLWMVVGGGLMIALSLNPTETWGVILWALYGSTAVVVVYLGVSTSRFFHSNLIYSLFASATTAILMTLGFGSAKHLLGMPG